MSCIYSEPLCFWAWNGEMDHERIKDQLRALHERGMAGVFIHARTGLKIPYMGEEWMNAFEVAVKECERLGMQAWIYDEDGWPSGFGGGKVYAKDPDYLERYLLKKELNAGDSFPSHVVAVYRRTETGYEQVCADFLTTTAQESLMVIYAEFNPVYVDILNPDAVQYFIEVTHERYRERFSKYFGNVIPGIFTDEPHFSPAGLPWGKYVAKAFSDRNGYSIYEALPYLFEKNSGYESYRYDFWKNISEMIQENYARPYYEWCCKNNLLFTGHYACEEGQVDQIAVSGGVMPLYEYQHIPGVDSLGNRWVPAPVFKQAEAVAWQLGNRRVLCETYACSGYDATFSDIMWIWGYQAAMGVNVPCLSISMYGMTGGRKRDYPVFFSKQMPWWDRFPELSRGFARMNDFLLEGERRDGLLLIHPKTGVWSERGKDTEIEERSISASFRQLTESLLDLQREFDYGDEKIMEQHAKVDGTILYVGKRRYHTVMVPPTANLEPSTVNLLRQFSENGGKVLFVDGLPRLVGGRPAQKEVFNFPKTFLANRTDLLRKYFIYTDGPQEIELISRCSRRPAPGFVTGVRVCKDELRMLVVSSARTEKRAVRIRAKGNVGIIKGDLYGTETALPTEYDAVNDCTYADVNFDEQEVSLFSIRKAQPVAIAKPVSSEWLRDFKIETGDNLFVIDQVECSLNNSEKLPVCNTIFATSEVFRRIDGKKDATVLKMRYIFVAESLKGLPISLICEDAGVSVSLNGETLPRIGWKWDEGFGCYAIGDKIRDGKNEVVLERSIGPYRSKYNLDEVFQSVTNVFSYEYDVENIYIMGRFDVISAEDLKPGENCYWISGQCKIVPYTEKKDACDLTLQYMPYYAGVSEFTTAYRCECKENDRFIFVYGKPNFVTGELFANGEYVGSLGIAPYRLDITKFLHTGTNTLRIRLYSTARNLFGPHHHVKGRHNYIGPSIFRGNVEFEDPVVFAELVGKNTWIDSISVIPFGLSDLQIIKEKKS